MLFTEILNTSSKRDRAVRIEVHTKLEIMCEAVFAIHSFTMAFYSQATLSRVYCTIIVSFQFKSQVMGTD